MAVNRPHPLVRHWHNLRSASQPPSLPSIRPPLSEMRASPLDCCLPDRHCQTSATQPPLPGPVRFGNFSVLGSPVPTFTPNLLGNQVSVNAEQFQAVHGPLLLVNSFGLNSNSREPLFQSSDIMALCPGSPLPADHSFHASWFDIRRFVPQGFMALTAARICRCHLAHQLNPRLAATSLRGRGTRSAVQPIPPPLCRGRGRGKHFLQQRDTPPRTICHLSCIRVLSRPSKEQSGAQVPKCSHITANTTTALSTRCLPAAPVSSPFGLSR